MQQSTLKKMSQALGISISTVSRALKDHPDISQQTKTRVKELASTLEYEPNSYAVQLRTQRSNTLGILVPSINNFFYDSFIAAIEEEAAAYGYSVMIMQSRDKAQLEAENLHIFRKNMVMGLFISVSSETEDLAPFEKLTSMKIPFIFVDRVPAADGFSKVCMADIDAAQMAAEAIIAKGKKNVLGLFGQPSLSISRLRQLSFQETFAKMAPGTHLVTRYSEGIEESKNAFLAAMKEKHKPEAVFCISDMILVGVMQGIVEMGLKVPQDISVISISNGLIPTLYNPQITHIETNGFKLGKLAFTKMLSALNEHDYTAYTTILDPVLVPGNSL